MIHKFIRFILIGIEMIKSYFKILKYKILYIDKVTIEKPFMTRIGKYSDIILENKNARLNIGKNFSCRRNVLIRVTNGNLSIGKRVFINNNSSITCRKNISIGNNCIIGEGVRIYDHNHKFNEKDIPFKEQGFKEDRIKIGNNVWIGSNCIILKGVKIGDNVVIGANTVVNEDIDSNCVIYNERKSSIKNIEYKQ